MLADADELVQAAHTLSNQGCHREASDRCADIVKRFSGEVNPVVRERVASALLLQGVSQEKLGSRERSIAAYDELIARFGDARESDIRLRVSWALWNKASVLKELSRGEEATAVYEKLMARCDEGLDAELDRNIAWCMEERAWELQEEGAIQLQIRQLEELVKRFGDACDLSLQRRVLRALQLLAAASDRLGERAQAVDAYDQILERFRETTEVELRDGVVATLINKALLLLGAGLSDEAISTYDEALALLGRATEPQLRDRIVMALVSKGDVLRRLKRVDEAVVVYESAAAAYQTAKEAGGGGGEALRMAVLALLYKVELLCILDRAELAHQVRAQLITVLGDFVEGNSDSALSQEEPGSDAKLAAAFADVLEHGDCWGWFEATEQEPPRNVMVRRATELYRVTEPWTVPQEEEPRLATQAAASMLRDVADGCAMLVRPLTKAQRSGLPLPKRAEELRTSMIRQFGVDKWSAELGYPLNLDEPADDDEGTAAETRSSESSRSPETESADAFVRFFLASAYVYELLAVLCDSPTGREAVQNDSSSGYASYRIAQARRWIRRITPQLPDATGAAMTCLWIAQGFFLVSTGTVSSSAALFPHMASVENFLQESGGYHWLGQQGVELPDWLAGDE